jgi:hypothetical protein
MSAKIYLGDSVYAEHNGFGVTLTTENGYGPTNTIVLEPGVLNALWLYSVEYGSARVTEGSKK